MLPWYDNKSEAERAAESARLAARTAAAKVRTERVIAAYVKASSEQNTAGKALIEDARR
jgi:hypothetical protein